MIKQYLDAERDLIGGYEAAPEPEIINPHDFKPVDEKAAAMESLIEDQERAKVFDKELAAQKELIKDTLGDKDIDEINDLYNKSK